MTKECFGPRLHAPVATFSGVSHLSKRLVQQLLKDLLCIDISLGAISAYEREVRQGLPTRSASAMKTCGQLSLAGFNLNKLVRELAK